MKKLDFLMSSDSIQTDFYLKLYNETTHKFGVPNRSDFSDFNFGPFCNPNLYFYFFTKNSWSKRETWKTVTHSETEQKTVTDTDTDLGNCSLCCDRLGKL